MARFHLLPFYGNSKLSKSIMACQEKNDKKVFFNLHMEYKRTVFIIAANVALPHLQYS